MNAHDFLVAFAAALPGTKYHRLCLGSGAALLIVEAVNDALGIVERYELDADDMTRSVDDLVSWIVEYRRTDEFTERAAETRKRLAAVAQSKCSTKADYGNIAVTIQIAALDDGDVLPVLTRGRSVARKLMAKGGSHEHEEQWCSSALRVTVKRREEVPK